jgi:hypothetical protein
MKILNSRTLSILPKNSLIKWFSTRIKERRLKKMLTRKKKLCILAILALTLIIVSACSTAPAKIEVVDPALAFPYFPDPLDAVGNPVPELIDQTVMIPVWYWIKITEYVIEVEKVREIYEAWQLVYEKR